MATEPQHEQFQPSGVRAEIEQFLRLLHGGDSAFEIRALKKGRVVVSGYYDNPAQAAQHIIQQLDRQSGVKGVYVTLNPVKPAAMSRSARKLQERAENTTSDDEILRRRWLLVDFDPERLSGISSTSAEAQAAIDCAYRVKDALTSQGWPEPVVVASGNGAHLLYHVDLPTDDASRELIQRVLLGLSQRYSDERVKVDTSTYNAARITKIAGTWARKGDNTPERPHRRAELLSAPDELQVVTAAQLEAIAAPPQHSERAQRAQGSSGPGHIDDIEQWLQAAGVVYRPKTRDASGRVRFELEQCPWAAHAETWKAWIRQDQNGDISAGCQADKCKGRGFREMRDALEPGWRAGRRDDRAAETPAAAVERKPYRLTEQGNADRLLDKYGADLRYCSAYGFLMWDGRRWKVDAEGLTAYRWAVEIVNDLYRQAAAMAQEAAAAGDPESDEAKQKSALAEALLEWARKSSRHTMYAHMVAIIRSFCEVEAAIFDADPWAFNCANGTIDLHTGELRPHRREDYLTLMSPVEYDPRATAPRWERFLREVTLERAELVDYLQRALGYTLTGDTSEQVWHLLTGDGENGKGTLIEAIGEIMDDLTQEVEPEFITLGGRPPDPNAPSPVAASLKGKRLVKITETAEGARIDAAKVKKLSGGDTLTGRHLNKGVMRFKPTHKLWIYTNHRPQTRETTHAFWRRVRYIPFDLDLKNHPERKDASLPKKLRAEYPGILAWLVHGCLAWQREGLNPPSIVLEATAQYKHEMEPLRDFLSERCVLNATAWTPTAALWQAYEAWGKDFHVREMLTKSEFTAALKVAGCTDVTRKNQGKNARGWLGIGLLSDTDPDPDEGTSVHTFTPVHGTFGNSSQNITHARQVPESSVNVCERVNGASPTPDADSAVRQRLYAWGKRHDWLRLTAEDRLIIDAGQAAWEAWLRAQHNTARIEQVLRTVEQADELRRRDELVTR